MTWVTKKMQEIQPVDPHTQFINYMVERYIHFIKIEFENALREGKRSLSGVLINSDDGEYFGKYDPERKYSEFIGLNRDHTLADFEKIRNNLTVKLQELGFPRVHVEIKTRSWTSTILKEGFYAAHFVKDHYPSACIYVAVSW